MTVPDWWAVTLLALAAYRVWRILAEDSVLDGLRRRVLRMGDDWEKEGDPLPPNYRWRLGNFVRCPACLGFWVALAWWIGWEINGKWALIFAAPFAISQAVLIARKLDPLAE